MTEAPPFVHLHVRSHYSLLAAPAEVSSLVAAAAEDGQPALALTDNGNLFGAVEFFKACKDKKIKPIVGQTTYVAGRTRHDTAGADNPTYDLTLLAVDNQGLDNLKKLSGRAWLEGFSYRPRVDLEVLGEHRQGVIALSGTVSSQISTAVLQGDPQGAKRAAMQLRELFGADNFFFEVAETGNEQQRKVNHALRAFGGELGIPCVATNDVHYLKADDWLAQDIMLCIRSGKTVADPQRFRMGSKELFLKSRAQMAAAFADWPEALAQTVAIADRCSVGIEFGVYHLPVFQPEDGSPPDVWFQRICHEGALRRYGSIDEKIQQRLDYEIGVIKKLGFVSYFLIVQDFIQKAKSMGIPVGPGRGSAAGSIVAYVLGITDVCPLRYALLFERFLNPGRVSMPDIDIDFCGNRRDEVIQYVRQKYGNDCVCQIITFGTMASRGVLRDVGRVLDFPIADVDKLCKKVPQGPGASLQAALETDAELKAIRDSSPQHKRLFDLSLKLEGLARHSSIHAAGVVIADRPLRDYVPLAKNGDDIITQWQMTELEEVGLLKMDFLGLKTLTILQEAVRLVNEVHGVAIDLGTLPLDDKPTYELMARGETQGIFQLESGGMRELLTRLKPDTFEDVIAVLALYRPGPLGSGMVDMFVRRKHGEEPVVYPHAATKPVLEPTYGVIVYQEQVMQISNIIGGFSMTEADNLRKAMGKKKPEVMAKFKDQFVAGAKAQTYGEKFAKELFETMEYFAGYGFNKSHSTAYALVTYHTAWLKTHYPVEFTAANLTVESGNSDKIKEFVDEARRSGMPILPPSVNTSQRYFSVDQKAIRYGLGAIKGVGTRAADGIAAERKRGGPFTSLDDLCERLDANLLNKGALEAMTQAGAFDGLGRSRATTFAGIEAALRNSAKAREDRRRGQKMLFAPPPSGAAASTGPVTGEWPEHDRLAREKESLGFYLSGHPFEKRGAFLARIAGQTTASLAKLEPGGTARIAGMISSVRVLQIKQGKNAGQKMARFQLEDLQGQVPVTCFARAYATLKDRIIDDAIVFLTGRLDSNSEEKALLLDQLEPAPEVVRREVAGLVLHLRGALAGESNLQRIADIVAGFKGSQHLLLDVEDGTDCYRVRADEGVKVTDDLLDELALLVGPENMSFTRQ
ncbi:MAG: DNA polymerase III subunit alpha [Planctomycetes bacterium]|jgi:DNA polymerase-3 subunit alpha|nr:DNA polymerase III subunit alpha [Planctomycetota bacterium]